MTPFTSFGNTIVLFDTIHRWFDTRLILTITVNITTLCHTLSILTCLSWWAAFTVTQVVRTTLGIVIVRLCLVTTTSIRHTGLAVATGLSTTQGFITVDTTAVDGALLGTLLATRVPAHGLTGGIAFGAVAVDTTVLPLATLVVSSTADHLVIGPVNAGVIGKRAVLVLATGLYAWSTRVSTNLVVFENLIPDTLLFIRVKTLPATTVLSGLAEVLVIDTLHVVAITALVTTERLVIRTIWDTGVRTRFIFHERCGRAVLDTFLQRLVILVPR